MTVKYDPKTMKFAVFDYRGELIAEGRRIASRLSAYRLPVPSAGYLKSGIEINEYGLNPRPHYNYTNDMAKVPDNIIQNVVNDGKKRLEIADKKADVIFSNMPDDVANICLSNDGFAGNKGAIIKELVTIKRQQLRDLCVSKILPLHTGVIKFEITILGQREQEQELTKEYKVHIDIEDRYRNPPRGPKVILSSDIFENPLEFLEMFPWIEEDLGNSLEYTFANHEGKKKVDNDS